MKKLSPAQQEVYFDHMINPKNPRYNIATYLTFKGVLDVPKLLEVLEKSIYVFDSLRISKFLLDEPGFILMNEPEKLVIDQVNFDDDEQPREKAMSWMQEKMDTPINIHKDSLFYFALLKISDSEYWVFTKFHHLITDGSGIFLFNNYLCDNYKALVSGEPTVESYPSFVETIENSRSYFESEQYEADKLYWTEKLEKSASSSDYTKKINDTGRCDFIDLTFSEDKQNTIKEYCKTNGISLQQFFLAVLGIYEHHISGSKSFECILPIHNKTGKKQRKTFGLFAKTVPFIIDLEDQSVLEFIQQIRSEQRRDYRHIKYPISHIKRDLNAADPNLTKDFDTFFNYRYFDFDPEIEGLKINVFQVDTTYSQSLLEYQCIEFGSSQGFFLRIKFEVTSYEKEIIALIRSRFDLIIDQLLTLNSGTLISEIEILPELEKQQLLLDFNNNTVVYPKEDSIIDVFSRMVEEVPENIAIVSGSKQLTYKELDEMSSQMASHLKADYDIEVEDFVGLKLQKDEWLLISILAVLKLGAVYVPIDLKYPKDRISYVENDCSCKVILNESWLKGYTAIVENLSPSFASIKISSSNLAYVMYTSGSTGTPKGVMVSHNNVVSLAQTCDYIPLNTKTIWLSTGSISFDATTIEFWGTLLNGGTLVLSDTNDLLNIKNFKQTIRDNSVNTLWMTASWFHQVVEQDVLVFEGIKYFIVGGDKVLPKFTNLLLDKYPNIVLVNGYGPTENTTFSTTYEIKSGQVEDLPIGKPINNRQAYIFDESLSYLQPIGNVGELCVGGEGLALGYLNQEMLTKEKFVKHPLIEGQVMYRTGDLAKWLPDGNIEFVGRKDDQVKIRGYRVELGEIENQLSGIKGVQQSLVLVKNDEKNNKLLVAYLTQEGNLSKKEIKESLFKKLPDYMIPQLFVLLESFPLNKNGKVDKNALPEPDLSEINNTDYKAPSTAIEIGLSKIWQELLGISKVGIHDNFFALGGHSLLASKMISRIEKDLKMEVDIRAIFKHPTIDGLKAQLSSSSQVIANIDRIDRTGKIPMSYAQERLWLVDKLGNGSSNYHIPIILDIEKNDNEVLISNCLKELIARHEVLRTVFNDFDGIGYQKVRKEDDFEVKTIDTTELIDDSEELNALISKEILEQFNLSEDYMMRATLLDRPSNKYALILVFHHIAFDGWSLPIFLNEFETLYNSEKEDLTVVLPSLNTHYADYSAWEKKSLSEETLSEGLQYWESKLKGVTPVLLPTDFPRPSVQQTEGKSYHFEISKDQTQILEELSYNNDSSLFMTLLAIVKVLLFRYSAQEDICIGIPVANRKHTSTDSMIGFFVNTIASRTILDENQSFEDLLSIVREGTLEDYSYEDIPFEQIVNNVVTSRDQSRSPIFQIIMNLQNENLKDLNLAGSTTKVIPYHANVSKFDLEFDIVKTTNGLKVRIGYCTALFKESKIENMSLHFKELMNSITTDPSCEIGKLSILPKQEILKLDSFNRNTSEYPSDKTVLDLFMDQVARRENEIAVKYNRKSLTYKELDLKSSQLANYLYEQGAVKGDLIPICVERSLDMIISVLGVMKSGCAYVPIDTSWPKERINFIIEETDPSLLICQSKFVEYFNCRENTKLVCVDEKTYTTKKYENLAISIEPNDLINVIYTSGTTGKPKGVLVEHKGMLNLALNQLDLLNVGSNDKVLQFASFAFDAFGWEVFSTLIAGGQLIMTTKEVIHSIEDFVALINTEKISIATLPPSYLAVIQDFEFNELQKVISAGEDLNVPVTKKLIEKGIQVINAYGPSENTVCVTLTDDPIRKEGQTSIGKPLNNVEVYITNDNLKQVPIGVIGELCVGGNQVARGYLNRPDLTEEKFVRNPFKAEGQIYRTGDLARWLPDGSIEFIGRKDHQVKIRGYRIELGEIEMTLNQLEVVKQSAVLVFEDQTGGKNIVAYITSNTSEINEEEIQNDLLDRLPAYMVPKVYTFLKEFPLNSSGKIDKKALPKPNLSEISTINYVAPSTSLEKDLVIIWEKLLDIPGIGIHNDFFALGGHSILASKLVSDINKKLGVRIDISTVFKYSTISRLGKHLVSLAKDSTPEIKKVSREEKVPLSFAQERLWFIDKLEGSSHYHIPVLLELNSDFDEKNLTQSLQKLVVRHEALRTVYYDQEGIGYQRIISADNFALEVKDLTNLSLNTEEIDSLISKESLKPFDLSKDYMLRATLVKESKEKNTLILVLHHIAFDGWSIPIFLNEFEALYNKGLQSFDEEYPGLDIQYADFSVWQRKYLSNDKFSDKLKYWESKLKNVEPLSLSTDYKRPAIQSTDGGVYHFEISEDEVLILEELTRQNNSTLFITMLAVFKVLLFRYSGQEDICVGIPTANRDNKDIENIVGLFVNTIATRTYIDGSQSFIELLLSVRDSLLGDYEHQDVPFEQVVNKVVESRDRSRTPIFQVMFNLQNEDFRTLHLKGEEVQVVAKSYGVSKFDLEFGVLRTKDGFSIAIEYCTALFKPSTIERMSKHFKELIKSITKDINQEVGKIPMLPSEEQSLLLNTFNDTDKPYDVEETILDLFSKQVELNPNKDAVVFEDRSITYKELDEYSNQLANHLISAYHIQNNDLVTIALERNDFFLIAILAVWKSGGAYIPISSDVPEERIKHIVSQSDSKIFITTKNYQSEYLEGYFDANNIAVVYGDTYPMDEKSTSPNVAISPNDLSYIIFTSGSTGNPKGAMIEHKGMLNHLYSKIETLGLDDSNVIAQNASVSFDISIWQFFTALLVGGKTVIYSKDSILNPIEFTNKLLLDNVDILEVVPSYLSLLVDNFETGLSQLSALSKLKYLMVTGETILPSLANRWMSLYPSIPIVNAYGPTEASDDITHFIIDKSQEDMIPIGTPVRNMKIYVLNEYDELTGIGIKGELCVSGIGVGRGYLQNPEKTAEVFVEDPFRPGVKMYRTGDLGRIDENGIIEFFGRNDFQVKLNGHRIELGEIENTLLELRDAVKNAVVDIKELDKEKVLVAYIVPVEKLDVSLLKSKLLKKLPNYMIPRHFVEMTDLPLTSNGKVNRKALKNYDSTAIISEKEIVQPRNERDELLLSIWKDVLKVDEIGIEDNFFELGGDSIIAIQIVSRSKAKGIHLQVKDIFTYQTIKELIDNSSSKSAILSEQGVLKNSLGLLPIQQYFFEQNFGDIDHYNQAVLLDIDKELDADSIEKVLQHVVDHHDSFGIRFELDKSENNQVKQEYNGGSILLEKVDLAFEEDFTKKIENICTYYQKDLSIDQGKLANFVWVHTPDSESFNRLFIVFHHLIVDGVSWRIFLDDFYEMLNQYNGSNEFIGLGDKTTSYRQWYKQLKNYASDEKLLSELPYWKSMVEESDIQLSVLENDNVTLYQNTKEVETIFDKQITNSLLNTANKAFGTEVNDLILTALSMILTNWLERDKIQICLEGHGREELFNTIDISRTTGWFTSMYPVVLESNMNEDLKTNIVKTKEMIRSIPNNGIGYGVLRYLSDEEGVRNSLDHKIDAILFNFSGDLDKSIQSNELFRLSKEGVGQLVGEKNKFPSLLEINAYILDGKLRFKWSYDAIRVSEKTLDKLISDFTDQVAEITEYCEALDHRIETPSDYGLAQDISFEELERFKQNHPTSNFVDILPLSPMQKGILFHVVYHNESEAYINQSEIVFDNEINTNVFLKSWEHIFETHSILRTSFHQDSFIIPVQAVSDKTEVSLIEKDLSDTEDHELEELIKQIVENDKKKGFDISKAPLIRFTLIRLPQKKTKLIITNHGIIADGWSLANIMKSFITNYNTLFKDNLLPEVYLDDYRDFISHLSNKNYEEQKGHWKDYLSSIESPSFLPFIKEGVERNKVFSNTVSTIKLNQDLIDDIGDFTQSNKVTVNTLMQATWGFLLNKYNNSTNSVFGVAISGRDNNIKNVESKIGLYINTIPVVVNTDKNELLTEWLQELQSSHTECREEFGHIPLNEVQNLSQVNGTLFDTLLVFQNFPFENYILEKDPEELNMIEYGGTESSNFSLTITIVLFGEGIKVLFSYNNELIPEEVIKMIQNHFVNLLESLVSKSKFVKELNYLADSERNQLLHEFNDTYDGDCIEKNLIEVFEKRVLENPNSIAIVHEERTLTYKELDEKSNQLANYLLKKHDVKIEDFVCVKLDRGEWLIISFLAILKAGGVYVPIDIGYPQDRVKFIEDDTNCKLVIDHGFITAFEAEQFSEIKRPDIRIQDQNLAYVIYTSGSTGKPKGVMIEHRNLLNLCLWHSEYFGLNSSSKTTVYMGVAFDASIAEICPSLYAGATLYPISDSGIRLELDSLCTFLEKEKITQCFLPCAIVHELVRENKSLRNIKILTGGDTLKINKAPNFRLYNCYGPTENTVIATCFDLDEYDDGSIPIGKPVQKTDVYILNDELELVPIGVKGKVYVSGKGVARGYLNRPELTNEKFILNPFKEGEVMYNTGDIAEWLPTGNIRFIGREDFQIKIKGFRIELGEIENELETIPEVEQAIVLVKEDAQNTKTLVAYIIGDDIKDTSLLHEELLQKLPEYMVPKQYVKLKVFPVNTNGKIDRSSFPEPEEISFDESKFVAAVTTEQKLLANIWKELLNISVIGITDNFFELGGDSIKALQMVGKAKNKGLFFKVKDIFSHQTIQNITSHLKKEELTLREEGKLSGSVLLGPIQKDFFDKGYKNQNHYNQSVLLEIDKSIDLEMLRQGVEYLVNHHDMLRLKCEKDISDEEILAVYGDELPEVLEVSAKSSKEISKIIENYQKSLNLENGEIIKFVLINISGDNTNNRLFMAAHHIGVDAVSWRIIVEDFERILQFLKQGKSITLGKKTTSFRQWQRALRKYGENHISEEEFQYWKEIETSITPLPVDNDHEHESLYKDIQSIEVVLNKGITHDLIQEISRAYNTEINDILLSALVKTLSTWTNQSKFVIGLEGHGREELWNDIDLSRTVGWFTSMYPVVLQAPEDKNDLAGTIINIKEMLRAIPNRGIGYGVLKHLLSPKGEEGLAEEIDQLLFNYLGDFDLNADTANRILKLASEQVDHNVSLNNKNNVGIELESFVKDKKMHFFWRYDSNKYHKETVEALSKNYLLNLQELIEHCKTVENTVKSPSDLGLTGIASNEELQNFITTDHPYPISDLYKLSPTQEGILFHSLYSNQEGYICQISLDLIGEINVDLFKEAWEEIFERYDILRTAFHSGAFSRPVQSVFKGVEVPITKIDLTTMSLLAAKAKASEFLLEDQNTVFDLSTPPLIRFALIHLPENRTKLVITNHHLILDGWSLPILLSSWLENYEALSKGNKLELKEKDSYKDLIKNIETRNHIEAENYWKTYLSEVESPSNLPFVDNESLRNKLFGNTSEKLQLDDQLVKRMNKYCDEHLITLNTLMQGAWSYLLSKYTNQDTVAFGTVISGRNGDISNIDRRVGLYINTIPVVARLTKNKLVSEWLKELQEEHIIGREEYGYLPLSEVQKYAPIDGSLFDTILVFENYPVDETTFSQTDSFEIESFESKESNNYSLTLTIEAVKSKVQIDFDYNNNLVQNDEIQMIQNHLVKVLESIISTNQTLTNDIAYISDREEEELINSYNQTDVDRLERDSLLRHFSKQVNQKPNDIALHFESESWTYQELEWRSNQIAQVLTEAGAKTGDLIPIYLERSPVAIAAILGILKIGACYVPINDESPEKRVHFILNDITAKYLVTNTGLHSKVAEQSKVTPILLDTILQDKSQCEFDYSEINEDQIYVIYTSGTTGTPKGVKGSQKGLLNRLHWGWNTYPYQENEVCCHKTSISFVDHVAEIFSPLLKGVPLLILTNEEVVNVTTFTKLVDSFGISRITLVPSLLRIFIQEKIDKNYDLENLNFVFSSGESLPMSSAKKFSENFEETTLINLYGSTEVSADATYYEISQNDEELPIGRPIDNIQVFVLDDDLRIVPIGVQGQIYVSGVGLSTGYLNNEELTSQKFVSNPYVENTVMYNTGDLGIRRSDGNILYKGRGDNQVKIRGHRVELAGVEAALEQISQIDQAITLIFEDKTGDKNIVAYIKTLEKIANQDIDQQMRKSLPDYMIPSFYVRLDEFPLNSSGKVDRKALENFEIFEEQELIQPTTSIESDVISIWAKVLGIEVQKIGANSSFFTLGGNSIKAFNMVSAIRKQLGVTISIRSIFEHPTVRELAEFIGTTVDKGSNQLEKVESQDNYVASAAQQRMFFNYLKDSENTTYNLSGGLVIEGELSTSKLKDTLQKLVDRHSALRTNFTLSSDGLRQVIHEHVKVDFQMLDHTKPLNEVFEDFTGPMDLVHNQSLFSSGLYKENDKRHVLLIKVHHIICDGISVKILLDELIRLYKGDTLPALQASYVDYSYWQQNSEEVINQQRQYWEHQLKGELPRLILPMENFENVSDVYKTSIERLIIDGETYHSIKNFINENQVSNFMFFITVFNLLLHKITGSEDIIIGTDAVGRTKDEFHDIVGTFINILPLRAKVSTEYSFEDLLKEIKETTLKGYENQDFQFDEMVRLKYSGGDIESLPIVQFHFRFVEHIETQFEYEVDQVIFKSLTMEEEENAVYKIQVEAIEDKNSFHLKFLYNAELYDHEMINVIIQYYNNIIENVIHNHVKVLEDIEM